MKKLTGAWELDSGFGYEEDADEAIHMFTFSLMSGDTATNTNTHTHT